MKFLFIVFLICAQCSLGQSGRTMYFSDIGWTVTIQKGFDISDSSATTSKTRVHTDHKTHVTLFKAKKDDQTYFIASYDSSYKINENNWQTTDSIAYDAAMKITLHMFLFKADTLYTTEVLDGVVFKKSEAKFFISKKETKTIVYLRTYYKKFYFCITYSCNTDESLEEIYTMLKNSRFDR